MSFAGAPFPISGYVLAGGKSSRMGHDKALLELAGKPLIAHAVAKLGGFCADVAVLSANSALAQFAPIVADRYPGCGPLGGIDAALAHTTRDWCLILPVDMPFLPSAMLQQWVRAILSRGQSEGTRVAIFVVDGKPQPALLLVHCDLAPYVSSAIASNELKLLPMLSAAAADLASQRNLPAHLIFRKWLRDVNSSSDEETDLFFKDTQADPETSKTGAEHPSRHLFFANLNTPENFAEASRHLQALEAPEPS